MLQATLLPDLITLAAQQRPLAVALSQGHAHWNYAALHEAVTRVAAGLMQLGVERADRVGIYLEKRFEAVAASFAAPLAGAAFVPINPVLKAQQVAHILRDCNVRVLVTSPERLALLAPVLSSCPDLRHVVLCAPGADVHAAPATAHVSTTFWQDLLCAPPQSGHRVIDTDLAAILYTSGSTGQPKGVMLSHRNLMTGAASVASYLENQPDDVLLAALPLSFDAGFSQLTTAFLVGARVVLLNYLLPRDVLKTLDREKVTGMTAVPPLYLQLINAEWPEGAGRSLRYWANTGGHMPQAALAKLRQRLPQAKPFLMYGLTEAFRSTYLPPQEVDRKPNSIGKAIPNAEVLVLRPDGTPCAADEPGELVHRGPLVALGYWNDAAKTAERFKVLLTGTPGRPAGLQLPEVAVYSGDTVRQDVEGFLYFVGRRDEMIKTSGYRVSPTEVEDIIYATGLVNECVAFGVPHAGLGQAIQIIATNACNTRATGQNDLINECRTRMPTYMVPANVAWVSGPLPRNANGKIDRAGLASDWLARPTSAPL
ncbi:acyl-CoA ligase (AMP-forming), exosortase A system-associated [Rhodoferax antarcticus]|uniref:AMP-binding enzyme family protein n=1 Tax=Rhodoferax antarcticus ANT.BR TaxID=1111071 RepID=A0A1Q8YH61_9BURK|nr:acyl-CoA ligase (AMP-forming), exosortase A system-associated [Rhodoferax antarcticus]APW45119.1 acyl-CoA ligase (AMP-forming), exosortase A system-associated [Rhodoferax antarcticus]MCW2313582.1 acyl-CoA ligase (AMP-forming) (exosortase A-associated) [Rhodoferax antarcticus]OLP07343.1 AMP-binding enzyme family protein [Rhodoferax antarcticus ANT.BR]